MAESALGVSGPSVSFKAARKKVALVGLKLTVAGTILAWLIVSGQLDLSRVWAVQSGAALVAVVVCKLVATTLPVVRWYIMARALGLQLPLPSAVHIGFIGNFFSTATPAMLGQDAARIVYGRSLSPGNGARLLSSVLADRMTGLATLVGLAVLFGAWHLAAAGVIPMRHLAPLGALMALLVAGVALSLSRMNIRFIRKFIWGPMQTVVSALGEYRRQPNAVTIASLLSLTGHMAAFASLYFAFVSLGAAPALFDVLSVSPVLVVLRGVPTTPLGLGVVDWFGELLYARIDLNDGAEVVMLTRLVTLLIHAACGIPFLIPVGKRGADDAQ